MNLQQIEVWAIRVVEAITAGERVEDDRVECKAEWPKDHQRAARRIAAHANAARGSSILWLIGVDEDARAVAGADDTDPAAWWTQVEARFDEAVAPTLRAVNVGIGEGRLVALHFETERAPYVVKTGTQGIEREIPIREATRVRTARRHEVLRMVVPAAHLPTLELISFNFSCTLRTEKDGTQTVWAQGNGEAFFETTGRAMLPTHRARAEIRMAGPGGSIELPFHLRFTNGGWSDFAIHRRAGDAPPPADFVPSDGVDARRGGVYIGGSGTTQIRLGEPFHEPIPAAAFSVIRAAQSAIFECTCGVAGTERLVTGALNLARGQWTRQSDDEEVVVWDGDHLGSQ
jgi:hypothetical protein